MKIIFVSLFIVAGMFGLIGNFAYASPTSTQISDICAKAQNNNSNQMPAFCEDYKKTNDTNPVINTISRAANLIAYLTGAVAVIMIIYAGFQFITSDGNADKVSKARQTILYAAVGLVVIMVARPVIIYVIKVFVS
jgi:hypothetical protein